MDKNVMPLLIRLVGAYPKPVLLDFNAAVL